MSVNSNVTRPNAKKKVLMSSPTRRHRRRRAGRSASGGPKSRTRTGRLSRLGYEVEIRSPQGGALQADGYSDPEDASGYSAHDILSLGFKKSPAHLALIQDTKSTAEVDRGPTTRCSSPAASRHGHLPGQREAPEAARGLLRGRQDHGARLSRDLSAPRHEAVERGVLVKGRTWTGFATSRGEVRRQLRGPADPAVLDRGRGPAD